MKKENDWVVDMIYALILGAVSMPTAFLLVVGIAIAAEWLSAHPVALGVVATSVFFIVTFGTYTWFRKNPT